MLLHPTSLPSRFGLGDLGPEVDGFLDWARDAGFTVWQVLPLGPPALGLSPYNCLSAFAGNPQLISPQRLVEDGWIEAGELDSAPGLGEGEDAVDKGIGESAAWKLELLRRAWRRFGETADEARREAFEAFGTAPDSLGWLDDWALFSALRDRFEQKSWWTWPAELAGREPAALERARRDEAEAVGFHRFVQFLFDSQWRRVRAAAAARGIELLGDLPIYVAQDSAEVWALPHLFDLDEAGQPRAVAGVPPDYFAETGQLWGNPLYRWDRMADDDYAWWTARLAANLRLTDRVRIDHFRAFAAYWRVPAGETTAIGGSWEPGPGRPLFEAMKKALGTLPVIAEDLGDITPDVHELRDALGLPGMKVLHFAFGEIGSEHAPHRLAPHSVVYTGTHDNDTTVGWWQGLDEEIRERVLTYLGPTAGDEIARSLVRCAFASVSRLAVVPMQDLLGLDGAARMNTPGLAEGSWAWQLAAGAWDPHLAAELRQLIELTERV